MDHFDSERPSKRFKRTFRSPSPEAEYALASASASHHSSSTFSPNPNSSWSLDLQSAANLISSFSSTTSEDTVLASSYPTPTRPSPENPDSLQLTPSGLEVEYLDELMDTTPNTNVPSASFTAFAGTEGPSLNRGPIDALPEIKQEDSKLVLPGASLPPVRSVDSVVSHDEYEYTKGDAGQATIRSSFHDCYQYSYGNFHLKTFMFPESGRVNSYIKCSWGLGGTSQSDKRVVNHDDLQRTGFNEYQGLDHRKYQSIHRQARREDNLKREFLQETHSGADAAQAEPTNITAVSRQWQSLHREQQPRKSQSLHIATPEQFGFPSKMAKTEWYLWDFYVRCFCPGRSILKQSNFWLTEFASMQEIPSVRASMQCLAATYVYDYLGDAGLAEHLNRLFSIAEERLTELLNKLLNLKEDQKMNEKETNELVTITSALCMQDIILFERRRKGHPRWWIGFMYAARCLRATDTGTRYWNPENIQISALRVAQSIIVSRGIILAQPMMRLPEFKEPGAYTEEANKFNWLLDDTAEGMLEIQGGCGFSKKLLITFHHITSMAAQMQLNPKSTYMPMSYNMLQRKIRDMKQSSRETRRWESEHILPPVEWVRTLSAKGIVVESAEDMTHITAECWRIAALIYLQCRVLRLPRNHPEVIENVEYLACCIRIMPTSGSNFTAQAPLFPVFLLGVVGQGGPYQQVSRQWFESVTEIPVRSSVLPLFKILEDIWEWIDIQCPIDDQEVPGSIEQRPAWWETLVAHAHRDSDPGVLCLT